MNCNPILSAKEFKDLHNSLCDFDSALGELHGVIDEKLYARLSEAKDKMRASLKNAYEQDTNAFDKKYKAYEEARALNNFKSVWSIYRVTNMNAYSGYSGFKKLIYRDHWGSPVELEITKTNLSWLDLYELADRAIQQSGDTHHIFIERIAPANEAFALVLQTGS